MPLGQLLQFKSLGGLAWALAHELGHILYLEHVAQKHFLMGMYGGVKITEKTIIEARENYKNYLKEYLEQ